MQSMGKKKGSIKKPRKRSKVPSPESSSDGDDDKIKEASDENSVTSKSRSKSADASGKGSYDEKDVVPQGKLEDDNYSKESSVQLVDLSNYYKKDEVAKLIDEKVAENNIQVKEDMSILFAD